MDPVKTGALIRQFRTQMHLTQKELAARLHVSDKAVSKWERGNGCPDISLLAALAALFGTEADVLLSGELKQNESEKGNMKKMKFYVCKTCGNCITATSEADVACCGAKLAALEPQKAPADAQLQVEDLGGEWFVTSDHPMTKDHYITFVSFVNDSIAIMFKQYPEWNLQCTLPRYRAGRLIWYCTQCGLQYQDLQRKAKKE